VDFALPSDVEALRRRVAALVAERIVPLEADRANYDEHENIAVDVLQRMRDDVKAAGLWAPQSPKHLGGLGLSVVGRAACYDERDAFWRWDS
jgi:acyl-CoA dehydrogenase